LPIVASRGGEIRRLLLELSDPKRRAGAVMRLQSLGARVVPHVTDELGRLDEGARRALLDALKNVQTADAEALRRRLLRAQATVPEAAQEVAAAAGSRSDSAGAGGPESQALETLRTLPLPRRDERAAISRAGGEAHLALARDGSRLAGKDLLLSLDALGADRARLCCEAAGLIGDAEFLAPLARLATFRPEAAKAIQAIAAREKITARSKALRSLDEASRLVVARSLAAG
jgi:hypothetical protein